MGLGLIGMWSRFGLLCRRSEGGGVLGGWFVSFAFSGVLGLDINSCFSLAVCGCVK